MAQSKAILAVLAESPSTAATSEPSVNLADPAQFERLASRFYLTDLVNCESYRQTQDAIMARYTPDEDDQWPDGYWDDLQQAIDHLLRRALELNEPEARLISCQ
jgi:hypothetical protein